MLVEIDMDPSGNVLMTPVSRRVMRQMNRHLKEMAGHPGVTVLFNEGREVEQLLESDLLSKREIEHIEAGWTVTKRIDPWVFGHYVGYDFHEVIDP